MPPHASAIEQKKNHKIAIVAVVAILLALISIARTQCRRGPTMDKGPFLALGEVAAEETAKVLGNKGQIVILTMETGGTLAETSKLEISSFLKTLKKKRQIRIAATEVFQPPPFVDSDSAPPTDVVTGEFLVQVVRKYPDANAVVSFAGAPLLQGDQIDTLAGNTPRLIVASKVGRSPRGALKRLFNANLVLFAVTPRNTAAPAGTPKTAREVFDKFYQVVTPDNAAEILASP